MATKFLSVEEAHIKSGQTCKLCNQQVKMTKDESKPVGYFKQEPHDGQKSFVISYRISPHDSGLCHFHLKKKQGHFNSDHIYEEIQARRCNFLKMLPLPAKRS